MTQNNPKEVTVTIKGDESTYRQKFLTYEPLDCSNTDNTLEELVREARESYKGEVEEVKIKISLQWL